MKSPQQPGLSSKPAAAASAAAASQRRGVPTLAGYLRRHLDQGFVLIILASVVLINYLAPQKIAFINFYFLPVIVAGYLAGVRTSVTGAFLCVLLVAMYAIAAPDLFTAPETGQELGFHIMAWGGFLVLAGYVVGKQTERNAALEERERVATVVGLSKLAEYRDEDTGNHLLRIRRYTEVLARSLAAGPHRDYLHEARIHDLLLSCVLHDIGKVAVPDAILLKPGRLTPEEFAVIQLHPENGRAAIAEIRRQIGHRTYLEMAEQIALRHHERWDGSGYPAGLRGEEIPLSARIVALADVYDALTTKRTYKDAFPHEEARRIILSERAKHFDPAVVDAFLRKEALFSDIREACGNPDPCEVPPRDAAQPARAALG
jgi:HD-GYP domain-containing protein (c-di-GMP phosphodiesterase class II)